MPSHATENRSVTSAKPIVEVEHHLSADENLSRGRMSVRVEALAFEVELARKVKDRLESEIRRLQQQNAGLEAERTSLHSRLHERERYLGAIHASYAWKLIQNVRGLFGRRW